MLPQPTIILLLQYASQALLALIVMYLLRRFYKNYLYSYFQYWSWSWLGLMIFMIGSGLTVASVFFFNFNHPIRTILSLITVLAGLFQSMWLLIGSYELSSQKIVKKKGALLLSTFLFLIALLLVLPYANNVDTVAERLFLRVGVRSFLSGTAFISSALLIFKLRRAGIGIRFIIVAFSIYGLELYNYFFTFLFPLFGLEYLFRAPYYMGIFDFLLQAVMGIGMIMSVLELEQLRLEKANNELDTFLYRASHDLRAPLTTILALITAIRAGKEEKDTKGYVDLIEHRVFQADKVIKDIITLRKGQKVGIEVSKIHLKHMVYETFNMLTTPSGTRIELRYTADNDEIYTDKEHLQTIVTNLLSNAINYHNLNQSNPFIEVSVAKTNADIIKMKVVDNGVGIESRFLPKIFDMFYRANENSSGSGLGLYLTRDALDQIEGTIEVSSEVGVGSEFSIYLKNFRDHIVN